MIAQDTIYIISKDTVFINSLDPNLVAQYTDILEKTNSQLGMLSNPYGVMVGALSLLFTILTLISAYIIFKQSKDYRDRIDSEIAGYRSALDAEITSFRESVKKDARESQSANGIEIRGAVYGSDRKHFAVSSIITRLLLAGKTIYANNDLAGDPHPGVAKTLTIKFVKNGAIREKLFNEGELVTFD